MVNKNRRNDFKLSIGDIVKDEKRYLVITDREYRKKERKQNKKGKIYYKNEKWYKYHCNKCGLAEGWVEESNLLNHKVGCLCCCKICKPVLGINTIWDTDRWMCDLGVSEEDAKKYTKGSGKKITVICPDCGEEKIMTPNNIYSYKSIKCKTCNDGLSYPEKFMTSLLRQLNLKFKTQLSKTTFEWCNKYRYDFYIPSLNMIIEAHGIQHYEENNRGKSLKEEQENDRYKEQLARENGIENYIVIDCRYSEMEYIKNSVLNSELSKIFNLSKIDWLKCEEFALKNIVKQVCDYWNQKEDWETTNDLAKIFHVSSYAVVQYLHRGTKLNWCNYNGKEELKKIGVRNGSLGIRKVEIFKDGVSLGIFESISELVRQSEELFGVKLDVGNITKICNGKRKHHKGFSFQYL